MEERAADNADTRRAEIADMAPWFHNIHLPGGLQTAPDHWLGDFPSIRWDVLRACIPERLDGRTALDIGCNAGFYTMELARRGAQVVAIDAEPHYLRQAQWVAQQLGLEDRIEFRRMQAYDLAGTDETFDIV